MTTESTTNQSQEITDAPAGDSTTDAKEVLEAQTDAQTDSQEAKPEDKRAPEYADFAAPEGVQLNQEVLGKFKELAKARNLTQEDAQGFVDMAVELQQTWAKEMADYHQNRISQWREESTKDKEFGGDNVNENVAIAEAALNKFGTPELHALLKETGMSQHPEVIRYFYRVGKATGDDKSFEQGTATKPNETVAQRMFPGMNP